jgi:DNA-binding transcriptional LysR family regulator
MPRLELDDLDAFAAIARRRSFRQAALERGVSASTLSQTLRDLEARLGVRLLNRTTRSVALTEAGARLLEQLSPALAEIAQALDQVRDAGGRPRGSVRINAPEPAVELVLTPMVAPFLAAHPEIELEIISETGFVDIVAAGFDAGVRWGESLAQDMVAVPISGPQRYVLVGAPKLIAEVGAPQRPEDLLGKPCIRLRFPSGLTPPWEFERDGREVKIEPQGRLTAGNVRLQLEAAIAGLGFYTTFEGYAAQAVADGRLVSLLEDWLPPFPGPFLYFPSRRHVPPALRAFVDFVRWRG